MSHYLFKITLAYGKPKSGQVTGKTEILARERLQQIYPLSRLDSIRPKPDVPAQARVITPKLEAPAVPKNSTPVKPAQAPKSTAPKSSTKLDKLLFQQSNKCFFCGKTLTKAEASIEHLQPKSGGGNNADGNVVACCVTLNRTFGSISLKRKMEIILEKAGKFMCPKA
jgi:hypothetical protein